MSLAGAGWKAVSGLFRKKEDGSDSPVVTFLTSVKGKIEEAWNAVVGFFENGTGAKIGQFLSDAWGYIVSLAGAGWKAVSGLFRKKEDGSDSPVVKFLNGVKEGLVTVWGEIEDFFEQYGPKIGQFLVDAFGYIKGFFKGEENTGDIVPEIAENDAAEAEQRVSLFERIATSLGDLASKVAGWNGWQDIGEFLLNVAKGITGFVTSIATSENMEQLGEILTKTFNLILDIMQKGVEFVDKLVKGDAGSWMIVLAVWIGKLSTNAIIPDLDPLNSFGMQLLELGAALALVSLAINMIGNMDPVKLLQGVGWVALLCVGLGLLIPTIKSLLDSATSLTEAKSQNEITKGWQKIANNFVKWVGIAGTIAVTMSLLPGILKAMGEAGLKGDDLFDIFEGVTIFVGALSLITGILSKLKIDAGSIIQSSAALAVAMPILSFGIMAAVSALGSFVGISGDTVKMVKNFAWFIKTIREAFTGKDISAKEMEGTADDLKTLSEKAKDIDEEGLKKLESVMGIFQRIGNMKIHDATIFGQIFNGTLKFSELPGAMDSIGAAMVKFGLYGQQLNEIPDAKNAIARANDLVDLLGRLAELASYAEFLHSFKQFKSGSEFLEFIDKISDPKKYNAEGLTKTVETFSGIAENINTAILEAVPNINTEPLINAVYDSLVSDEAKYKLVSAFEQLGQNVSEEGITLSGESVNVDFSSLLSLFSGSGGLLGGLFGGENGIGGMLSGLLGENGQLTSAVNKFLGTDEEPGFLSSVETKLTEFSSNPEYNMGNILGLTTADGEADMQAYITALEGKLAEFKNGGGLDSEISMVLDESSMPAWFNGTAALEITGTVNLDPVSLGAITVGISTLRDTTINNTNRIVDTLYNLNSRIDGLNDSIRSMRLVLDTGAIAGAVDSALGKRLAVLNRTGPTSGTNVQGGR